MSNVSVISFLLENQGERWKLVCYTTRNNKFDSPEELSAAAELLDEVQPLRGLEGVVELDQERVVDAHEHVALSPRVSHVRLAVGDLRLVDDFHRVHTPVWVLSHLIVYV